MTPDSQLLRQFARTNSQDAFAELVERHVNLVYSAALRQVNGDGYFAKDVAQTVFTDLARKASSLARRENLAGWLYTSAHFAAAKIARGENRRRDREEKFMREPENSGMGVPPVQSANETDWEKIRPALDDAMHGLKEADREAVLLRYFENRPFAEVGAKLGLNENAARMRVERALEKLRAIFAKRGITTATALASVISANAIQIAPANLAATLTAASIASAGTFTLSKMMTATRLKLGFSALVVAGVATAFLFQHQAQEKLRAENESLTQQLAQLQTDNESLSNRLATIGDSQKLTDEQFNELLKLRGELTRLRGEKNVLPEAAQSKTNDLSAVKKIAIQIHLRTKFASLPTEDLQFLGVEWTSDAQGGRTGLLTEQQFKIINEALQGASDASVISTPQAIIMNGEHATISVTRKVGVLDLNEDGTLHSTNISYVDTGTILEVMAHFSISSSTFDLNLNAKLIQLAGDSSQTNLQTIEVTNHVSLQPGQTVVLEKEIQPDKFLGGSTQVTAESKSLLMFVTPTVVKPSDYQPNGTRVDGIIDSLTNTDTDTSYFPNTPPQSPPPNQ
jgi:RNA polymerase sigma factor (sigma-70 family)